MSYSIKIIFGKEQVDKFFSNIPLSETEDNVNVKEFYFETQIELDAFIMGVNTGVGWQECYIVEEEGISIR